MKRVQAYDVELPNGLNTITLSATDRAGYVTNIIREYVYVPPTNPPVLALVC